MNLDHLTDADLDALVDGARRGEDTEADHDWLRELSAELAMGPVTAEHESHVVASAAWAARTAAARQRGEDVVALRPRMSNRAKAAVVASVVMAANVAPLAAAPLPISDRDHPGLLHHIARPFTEWSESIDQGEGPGRAVVVYAGESADEPSTSTTADTQPPGTTAPTTEPSATTEPQAPEPTVPDQDLDYYTGPELKPELPTDPEAEPAQPPPPPEVCEDDAVLDPATGECAPEATDGGSTGDDEGTGDAGDGQVLPPPPTLDDAETTEPTTP